MQIGAVDTLMPMLAQGWAELVVGAIGLIILVGSWIANQIKEQQSNNKSSTGSTTQSSEGMDLDEVAAQRREQLRQMARQRMEQSQSQSGSSSSGDQGASMADRIARARSAGGAAGSGGAAQQSDSPAPQGATWEDEKAQERRRAQQQERERRQREQQEQREAQRRQREEAERQRQAEQRRRAQEQAEQRAQQQQQRRQQQTSQRQQRQPQTRQRQPQPRRGRSAQPEPVAAGGPPRPQKKRGGAQKTAIGAATRLPGDPYRMDAARARAMHFKTMLQGAGVRDAIVLKEILDRPVATRDPDGAMWS